MHTFLASCSQCVHSWWIGWFSWIALAMHTLTFRHTNTPSTFLQGEINGKVIPRLKSWNHATAVQYCPTSSDFPHTRWHVAGGEISSLAKKYIQSFFSITGSEEGGGGLQMTGFLPMNSWLVWRDATWEESEGGDSYFLILPDLPAFTARIFGLGPLILFLLLLIQTFLFRCLLLCYNMGIISILVIVNLCSQMSFLRQMNIFCP